MMVIIRFTSVVLVAALALVSHSQEKNRNLNTIDSRTISEYEKLGARYGGWVTTPEGMQFRSGAENAKKGLPGFSFSKAPPTDLPKVGVPFGLSFNAVSEVNDSLMKNIALLDNLTTLDLQWTSVTKAGLQELAPLKKITMLGLTPGGYHHHKSPGAKLSDENLRALRKIGLLHAVHAATQADGSRPTSADKVLTLDLSLTDVTDVGLKELVDLKNLESLSLAYTQVTDKGISELASLQKLSVLNLNGTSVTDDGLKLLAAHQNLTELILSRTDVTESGLKKLATLPTLRRLNVEFTSITDAGVAELQKVMPKCKIQR